VEQGEGRCHCCNGRVTCHRLCLSSCGGQDIRSLDQLVKHVGNYSDTFPDAHFTIDDIVVEGKKVAVRYTFTGTHKGEGLGIPSTNKKVTIRGIKTSHRNTSGKIVEEWEEFDTLGVMRQLGLEPTLRGRK
jgi:steroid delta-isomerase-like uncharacterized protein